MIDKSRRYFETHCRNGGISRFEFETVREEALQASEGNRTIFEWNLFYFAFCMGWARGNRAKKAPSERRATADGRKYYPLGEQRDTDIVPKW